MERRADNLIGAQLVTADGEVRELGPGKNEDLYWAIRGGGGNFGVVTRLDFRLHPVVPVHSASFNIGWRDLAGALRAFGGLIPEAPDEARAAFLLNLESGASVQCGYRGDTTDAVALYREVESRIPPCTSAAVYLNTESGRERPGPQHPWPLTARSSKTFSGGVIDVLAREATEARGIGRCCSVFRLFPSGRPTVHNRHVYSKVLHRL